MPYEKLLIDSEGEEFPYSEELSNDGYYYRISVIYDDTDGELQISTAGSYLFLDSGGFIDFNVSPESIYPGRDSLNEPELLEFMQYLYANQAKAIPYSKDEQQLIYEKYLLSRNRRV